MTTLFRYNGQFYIHEYICLRASGAWSAVQYCQRAEKQSSKWIWNNETKQRKTNPSEDVDKNIKKKFKFG